MKAIATLCDGNASPPSPTCSVDGQALVIPHVAPHISPLTGAGSARPRSPITIPTVADDLPVRRSLAAKVDDRRTPCATIFTSQLRSGVIRSPKIFRLFRPFSGFFGLFRHYFFSSGARRLRYLGGFFCSKFRIGVKKCAVNSR